MLHRQLPKHGINNLFAKALPEKRTKRDLKLKFFCIIILYAVGCFILHDRRFIYYLVTTSCSCYLLFFITEIIYRLCSLGEERHHLTSRYNNCIGILLKEVFSFNQCNIICVLCSVLYSLLTMDYFNLNNFGMWTWACALLAMGIFVRIISLSWSYLSLAHQIDYLKGLDCGTYMAHGYFYGYLDIVVPCKGDANKGLREHLLDYESAEGINFAANKLYIFVPLSGYCPTSLSDRSHKFEAAKNLEYNRIDRSGVRGRDYHNSVYKIQYDKIPHYVCAEYASPLHTLCKITDRSSDVSGIYKKYHRDIVNQFYTVLNDLINSSPEFNDLVELIYFNDLDATGRPLNVKELDIADLILERLPKKMTN